MSVQKLSRTAAGIVGGVIGVSLLAPLSAQAAEAAPTTVTGNCPAARVTGLSALLDALSTGSVAGPSVLYGVALAALSQPLPEPFGSQQAQFLSQGAQGVSSLRTQAPQQIDSIRALIAPFSAGNEYADQGVDAFANDLDAMADAGGKTIAPGDMTLRQFATLVRVAREEPAKPC